MSYLSLSSQFFQTLAIEGGMNLISPLAAASNALLLICEMLRNHWGFINGSMTSPDRLQMGTLIACARFPSNKSNSRKAPRTRQRASNRGKPFNNKRGMIPKLQWYQNL